MASANSTPDTPEVSETDLAGMKLAELREHARARGITGADELHKPELLIKVKDYHYARAHGGAHRPDTPRSLVAENLDARTGPGTHDAQASQAGGSSSRSGQIARSGPDSVEVWLPGLGSVQLSRPELAYVGGIVGLSVLGFLDWPMALVVAAGHVLAADRSSKTVADLGQAMERA